MVYFTRFVASVSVFVVLAGGHVVLAQSSENFAQPTPRVTVSPTKAPARLPGLVIPAIVFSTVQVLDLHSTNLAISSGKGHESNPMMGSGNDAKAIAIKAGITAGTLYLTHKVSKKHPTAAKVTLYVLSGVIAGVVVNNYGVAGR